MTNFDESVKLNCNPNWPYIPDHPYRILIIGAGKINILLKLINQQPAIHKIHLYVKD